MDANLLIAALAGLVGAVVITLLIYLLVKQGQKIDIPYLIGTRFADIGNKSKIYGIGITLHLLAGAGWGMLYVFLLTAMAVTPNWPAGILWGFAHGIFVGVLMSTLSENHPHVGEGRAIDEPGILGNRWGDLVPYWILGLHVIYGACTLFIYHRLMTG